MVESVSLSAPVTVQVREYIDPAIGVATLVSTLTVMGGSGNEQDGHCIVSVIITFTLTVYMEHLYIHKHFTTNCCSTCVGPFMRGWQWIKCQCTHATICTDHLRGNLAVYRTRPGDSWLISWPSHSNRTHQAVGLTSSVGTRGSDGGSHHCRSFIRNTIIQE